MIWRVSQSSIGTTLAVVAAMVVTAQAFSAPAKPRQARDIVAATEEMQPGLALVCQMYPAECRFNADGSVARVVGRRIVPGTDRAVLRHFQTEIVPVRDSSWGPQ